MESNLRLIVNISLIHILIVSVTKMGVTQEINTFTTDSLADQIEIVNSKISSTLKSDSLRRKERKNLSSKLYAKRGDLFFLTGNLQRAINDFHTSMKYGNESAGIHVRIADSYMLMGNYCEAKISYLRTLNLLYSFQKRRYKTLLRLHELTFNERYIINMPINLPLCLAQYNSSMKELDKLDNMINSLIKVNNEKYELASELCSD